MFKDILIREILLELKNRKVLSFPLIVDRNVSTTRENLGNQATMAMQVDR